MSVAFTAAADNIQKLGYGPTRAPDEVEGEYVFRVGVTGDASAGDAQVDQVFDRSNLYSLEQVYLIVNDAGAGDAWVNVLTALPGKTDSGGFFPAFAFGPPVVVGANSLWVVRELHLPIMGGFFSQLGVPLVRATFETNIAARLYTLRGWGYFWNLNARRHSGGPKRPGQVLSIM